MRLSAHLFIAATAALACAACDAPVTEQASTPEPAAAAAAEPTEQSAPAAAATGKAVEITWEELMPEGEEARLEQLYSDYYEELERQFAEAAAKNAQGEDGATANTADLVATIAEGSASDTMDQIGTFNVVSELNGKAIRLPGYVVPFDFNAESKYSEFLLVPYFGACLHTPPPPPNQIVLIKAEPAASIDDIYEPVWVEGTLTTGEFNSDLADTAYELALSKIEAYVY